jgi:hypothetical protein
VTAVTFRPHTALAFGVAVCFILTPVIWVIAAVLGAVVLLPRWLWTNGRELVRRPGLAKVAHSSVWDDWLDGPS